MKPPPDGRRYPAASAIPTRASAAEAHPDDDAATALEPPKRTAETPTAAGAREAWTSEAAARMRTSTQAGPAPRPKLARPAVLAWIAIAALGVASGIVGAFFGIWLALGGG